MTFMHLSSNFQEVFTESSNVATDAVDSVAQLQFSATELLAQSVDLNGITHLNAGRVQQTAAGNCICHGDLIGISMTHCALSGSACLGSPGLKAGKEMTRAYMQGDQQDRWGQFQQFERLTMNHPPKRRQAGHFLQAVALVAGCMAIVEIVLRIVK